MHSLSSSVTNLIARLGYPGVFVWMLLESACIPIPSEAVMPYAGALAATRHMFNIYALTAVGAAGNVTGSMLAYGVGAWKGRPFVERYGRYLLITRRDLDTADGWFAKHGQATVFFTRVLPVVRTFISLPAGIARMPFGRFCLFTVAGSLPWCLLLTWTGYKLGQHWTAVGPYFHDADIAVTVVIALAIAWWIARRTRVLREENLQRGV